jgi:hypothetical protein
MLNTEEEHPPVWTVTPRDGLRHGREVCPRWGCLDYVKRTFHQHHHTHV